MRKCAIPGFVLAVLALTACSGSAGEQPEAAPATSTAAPAASTATAPAEVQQPPEEPPASADGVSYMDGPNGADVTSHMACTDWSKAVDDVTLTGDPALDVGARVIRSDDPAMAELASDSTLGAVVTDPWGLTKLCLDHGYEFESGSLAEEHYIESAMG